MWLTATEASSSVKKYEAILFKLIPAASLNWKRECSVNTVFSPIIFAWVTVIMARVLVP